MQVRDLGPLLVVVDGHAQPVVGTRGAAMLARLAVSVNERVSVDALMQAAWGEHVSPAAGSTLLSHIWRLRQLLEPGRGPGQPPTVLINDAGGYRLIGGASSIDSLFFAECVSDVAAMVTAGDAESAVRRAEAALPLWRGEPYGPFADSEWAQPAVTRLQELRSQLQERRIEALLAAGAYDVALADLQLLVAAAPYREALRGLQMLALHRSGRSEEALKAYQQARRALAEDIGIDPGTELQELHRRILRNDPSLIPTTRPVASPPRKVEVHLPGVLTRMIGREDVCRRLVALVTEHPLVTISGAAGCGKTRLAVEVARSAALSFPDGVWFVDLTAVSDPDLVIDVIVSTIGIAASAGATPLENLRNYVRTRRILLVLDNCEHVLSAVAGLIELALGDPNGLECCVLTTSREPISLDGEIVWSLEPLGLPTGKEGEAATAAPAVQLFLERLSAVAPAQVVDEPVLARVTQICIALDGLPLPVELAASRAASYSLDDIAAQVAADPIRLGRIGRGPADHRATLGSTIEWSHRLLSRQQRLGHRRMAVLSGPFTHEPAVAVIGDLDAADVDDLLAQLVHRSMLASDGAGRTGRPTAFRQLATVRSHAQHALTEAAETVTCVERRDAWTATLLAARPPLGQAAEADWYRAIDDNYATIRSTLARHLIEEPAPVGGRLAGRLFHYWYYRQMLVEATRWLQLGHDILLDDDPVDLILARIELAAALALQGRADLARPYIDAALERVPTAEPGRLLEVGEVLVGLTVAASFRDEPGLVIEVDRQLSRIVEVVSSGNLELLAEAVACRASFARGQVEESITQARSIRERARAAGNLMASWLVTGPPVITAMKERQPAEGIPWFQSGTRDHLYFGTGGVGIFIETRANFAAIEGDYVGAVQLYAAARRETRRAAMVWPRRLLTTQLLEAARGVLSRADFEHAWQDGERLTMAQAAYG